MASPNVLSSCHEIVKRLIWVFRGRRNLRSLRWVAPPSKSGWPTCHLIPAQLWPNSRPIPTRSLPIEAFFNLGWNQTLLPFLDYFTEKTHSYCLICVALPLNMRFGEISSGGFSKAIMITKRARFVLRCLPKISEYQLGSTYVPT